MSELMKFNFEGKEIRTTIVDGEPWAALKDVCDVLEIKDHYQVWERLDDDERGRYQIPTPKNEVPPRLGDALKGGH